MKAKLSIPLVFLAMAAMCFPALAGSVGGSANVYTVAFQKWIHTGLDDEPEFDPRKHRMPSHRIMCTITVDGIQSSVDLPDIESYEVWNADADVCMAVYADESDFVNHLFSNPGDYQIRLVTPNCQYIGYVNAD